MTPLLPYGICSIGGDAPRVGARLGDRVIDLSRLARLGEFRAQLEQPNLNALMSLPSPRWSHVRSALLRHVDDGSALATSFPLAEVRLHLPVQIADYTDFYSSYHHAFRVGSLFRGPDNALNPNWKQLPVGYHGRAGSVVLSGTSIRRPVGQTPQVAPTSKLDFELEMGFYIGASSELGTPVPIARAESHIFGLSLLNDWSARDIQAYEYQPLGPFTSKNFCTSVSPWVVPLEALEPWRRPLGNQDPEPVAYLRDPAASTFDIRLEVELNGEVITRTNTDTLYWSMAQQIAHHTVTGCNLRTGDFMGSGTISGPDAGSEGCLLEKGGDFLRDGDVVRLIAYVVHADGSREDLGDVVGTVLPAVI
jgi:fumarylacetoacetase